MNDDATARMERTGWSLVQWATRLAVVLGIAGIIFGLLFYFAHQAEPLAAKPPYAISADKPSAGGASQYSLVGTVASVDMASKTIRILGSDGREYVFALSSYGVVLTNLATIYCRREHTMKKIAFLLILFSLTACAAPAPAATPIPAFTFAPASPTPEPATATLAPTATAIPTETPTPEVKQFPTCQIEKFRDCPISVDDLFNGNYLRWLKTRSKPFDPAKLKWLPLQLITDQPGLPYIGYNPKTAPNYRDESTAPFRRLVTSGVVTYQGMDYLIIPIEFADPQAPGNPQKNVWTIGIQAIFKKGYDQNIAYIWKIKMHIPPVVPSDKDWAGYGQIPLVTKGFAEDPQMAERFKSFAAGQVSALDGKVVQIEIATTTDHSLE